MKKNITEASYGLFRKILIFAVIGLTTFLLAACQSPAANMTDLELSLLTDKQLCFMNADYPPEPKTENEIARRKLDCSPHYKRRAEERAERERVQAEKRKKYDECIREKEKEYTVTKTRCRNTYNGMECTTKSEVEGFVNFYQQCNHHLL